MITENYHHFSVAGNVRYYQFMRLFRLQLVIQSIACLPQIHFWDIRITSVRQKCWYRWGLILWKCDDGDYMTKSNAFAASKISLLCDNWSTTDAMSGAEVTCHLVRKRRLVSRDWRRLVMRQQRLTVMWMRWTAATTRSGFPLSFDIVIQGLSRTLKFHFQGPILDRSLQHEQ